MEYEISVWSFGRRNSGSLQRSATSACDALDIQILKGVGSKDHIHSHVSYPPKLSVSDIVKRLKGCNAKLLLSEYSELRRRYYGGHLWGIGYGVWSTGNITDEMVQEYLNHHEGGPNSDRDFILE